MFKNKVFDNAKWIIICKAAQSLLQLIIGMMCARYLGPSNYGIINYAASIVAFTVPIMQLGLQSTLVHEFVEMPEQEGKIMGTSLYMELFSGAACVVFICAFVSVVNRTSTETIIVCILYSVSLLFRAFELLQYWYQYKLQSKYPSIVMLCSYLVVSIYKIFLLATEKSIVWFAVVNSLDYGIIGLSLLLIYRKLGAQKLSFSFELAKRLFLKSKYYIFSAMMVTIFQNTDHIMLKLTSGDAENGYYSAAITCAGVCQFVYAAIIDSMRPIILTNKKNNITEYKKNLSRLYCIIIYMTILQSVGFTLFAKPIVSILYGTEYMASVPVLQILVWYVSFVYMGSVRNIWILAEGKQNLLWKINLAGAITNIGINSLLIPHLGAVGAAVASLLAQILSNFVSGFIVKPLRENNRLLLKGLNIKFLLEIVHK